MQASERPACHELSNKQHGTGRVAADVTMAAVVLKDLDRSAMQPALLGYVISSPRDPPTTPTQAARLSRASGWLDRDAAWIAADPRQPARKPDNVIYAGIFFLPLWLASSCML